MGTTIAQPPTTTASGLWEIKALDDGADGAREWSRWTSTMRVVVTDAHLADQAQEIVDAVLDDVELAASRFRDDSEVIALAANEGRPLRVSAVAFELISVAIRAAERTEGAVDPTLGNALVGLGYDSDLSAAFSAPASAGRDVAGPAGGPDGVSTPSGWSAVQVSVRPRQLWRAVRLNPADRSVTVPAGVLLDLGATAKAWAADRAAALVHLELGTSVLVSLGGDIATAGPGPQGGWQVLVQDRQTAGAADGERNDSPAAQVSLPGGMALASSSTAGRRWMREGRRLHHVLSPASSTPVAEVWTFASVAAADCVTANTFSTAAIVWGASARARLGANGMAARLVGGSDGADGIEYVGPWPKDAELARQGGHRR